MFLFFLWPLPLLLLSSGYFSLLDVDLDSGLKLLLLLDDLVLRLLDDLELLRAPERIVHHRNVRVPQ